jgi:hypothetical protein
MLVDNTSAVLAMLDGLVAQRVNRVASVLVIEHKRELSKPYPQSSKPGEFPARRTGNLRSDVKTEPLGKHAWRVGYAGRAPYILRLAALGRDTVLTSAGANLAKLRRAAEGK